MEEPTDVKALLPALSIGIILILLVVIAFLSAQGRTSSLVLPGGITYLGPSTTVMPTPTPRNSAIIEIPTNATWADYGGKKFPYHFSYPTSLSLGVFPNDPYDAVTVFLPGTDGSGNIFFRVDNLTLMNKPTYIGHTEQYARDWWKAYAWKGVKSITKFTNSSGLVGYRASYTDTKGENPYDHIFFEVPKHKDLVIWLSGGLFDHATFEKIVDSVSWKE